MYLIETLRAERASKAERGEAILAAAESRDGSFSDEERVEFDGLTAELRDLADRIADIEAVTEARKAAAGAAPVVSVKAEPLTYERHAPTSYYADLALAESGVGRGNPGEARARLERHATEMDVELARRSAKRSTEQRAAVQGASFERRAAGSTTGSAGYFIPPLWLEDQWIKYLRFGRPFVNSLRQVDLPEGTNSINIPSVTTGTSAAIQTADNASVSSTDLVASFVNAPVRTIAGQEDISLQLLEQAPNGLLDQVIFQDLASAYNQQCDLQALAGTGSSGQITGIHALSGTNSVTFTASSPSGYQMFTPALQAVSQIAKNRKRVDGVTLWMTPSRYFWLVGSLDSQNRPLVVPSQVAFNTMATSEAAAAEGYVANFSTGVPVAIDGNIASNYGTGTNQDEVYAVRGDDLLWFEGSMRMRVLPEVLSGTLGVRFQVYNYVAFLPRYASAVSVISGTGLTAPTGY